MTGRAGRRLLAVALFSLCGCSPVGREPAGDIAITVDPPTTTSPAFVRVGGLSRAEAENLRAMGAQSGSLSTVLTVTVQGADVPVVGRTVVNGAALEFHPTFPFDAGRPYVVRLDTRNWRAPRAPATFERVVSLPAPAETARVVVSTIRPSQDHWPENTLRFYVHFSGPMAGTSGVGKVHLVGEDGEDIPNALLPLDVDLWNDDRTRYTVLFDPARVKRGILSNREMGRALISGRRYAIVVDTDWRDAAGRPLAASYRHEFTAGPPLEGALDTKTWRLAVPAASTRDPIVVNFPYALDSALLLSTFKVFREGGGTVKGTSEVGADGMSWRFVPVDAWQSGAHYVNVAPVLEDPAGNRLNQPFEIDPSKAVPADAGPARLPFTLR